MKTSRDCKGAVGEPARQPLPYGRGSFKARFPAFTLIELILVLVVLALASGLTMAALSGFASGQVDHNAAARLLAVMRYAHDQAVNEGISYRVHVDPQAKTYQLMMQRGAQFVAAPTSLGRPFTLPETISVSWAAPADISQRDFVQFDPDGRHDAATLQLTRRDGQVIYITSDTMAQAFRIVTGGGM